MIEFDVGGVTYRASKLDAFKQLHVSRKLAPVVPKLIPALAKLAGGGISSIKDDIAGLADVLGPLADVLAAMPDETVEYLTATCLGAVQRKQGNSWSPVWSDSRRVLMFEDMDMSAILPIMVKVVQDSLGGFISGLLSRSTETQAETVSPT